MSRQSALAMAKDKAKRGDREGRTRPAELMREVAYFARRCGITKEEAVAIIESAGGSAPGKASVGDK